MQPGTFEIARRDTLSRSTKGGKSGGLTRSNPGGLFPPSTDPTGYDPNDSTRLISAPASAPSSTPTGYDPNDSTRLVSSPRPAPPPTAGGGLYDSNDAAAAFDAQHHRSTIPDKRSSSSSGLYASPTLAPNFRAAPLPTGYDSNDSTRLIATPNQQDSATSPAGSSATTDAITGQFSGGLYPKAGASTNLPPAGLPEAAANLDALARGEDAQREYALKVAPNIPQPGEPPEVRANKLAYLHKLIEDQANGTNTMAPDLAQPDTKHAYDLRGNAAPKPTRPQWTADQLADMGNRLAAEANGPRYVEDPVTGERNLVYGKDVVRTGTNPAKVQPKVAGPTELKKLINERNEFQKSGDAEAVKQYDRAIENYHNGTGLFGQASGTIGGSKAPMVPDAAISYLRANPDRAAQFDLKYGKGASARYLGQ